MKKNIIIFLSFLFFITNTYSANYILNQTLYPNSVDGDEIRWGGSTKYSTELNGAINTWNNYGDINIAPDTIFTWEDLTIEDVRDSSSTWMGIWMPSIYPDNEDGYDKIELNTYMLDGEHPVVGDFTSSEKQKTITHEFGHSLGLAHSLPGNIMIQGKISQTSLGTQDKADYDYMW